MKKWVLFGCLISLQSWAASISTYRIYLDSENRQQKFLVKNNSAVPEQCDISFGYMAYKDNGDVNKITEQEQNTLSAPALKRLRYSPRKFTIEPKAFQYIAFNYRRQINDSPAEHRTYANIKCLKLDDNVKQGISLKPAIMHSVPLVIRTGKPSDLTANLTFDNITLKDNTISFRLSHQGTRSVYGDLLIVDENGEQLMLLQRNVVIYPEMKFKEFAFSLGDYAQQSNQIIFQETGDFSQNQSFNLSLKGMQ